MWIYGIEKNLTGTYNVISENYTILEVAKRIQKLIGCEIDISTENEDKRNYKVSAEKLKQVGFTPNKKIEDAVLEIKQAIEEGKIKDYSDNKYSNYKLLFDSKEMQEKVFILGLEGSLDIP